MYVNIRPQKRNLYRIQTSLEQRHEEFRTGLTEYKSEGGEKGGWENEIVEE